MLPPAPQQSQPGQQQQRQQQEQLWGLAADLAADLNGAQASGAWSRQEPEPHGRYPGFGREHTRNQQQRADSQQPRAHASTGAVADRDQRAQRAAAFSLSQGVTSLDTSLSQQPTNQHAQGMVASASGAGAAHYGLVLELVQSGPANPLLMHPGMAGPQQPAIRPGARRGLGQQLEDASKNDLQQRQHSHQDSNIPPLGPQPTMPPAPHASAAIPEDEPDYGIVSELKEAGPPDQLARDFGLAAEVARRRRGTLPPLSGRYPVAAVRPRKRLAASGPPADFGLSQELAERQAAMERDPFSVANRVSARDPFVMATEVKFPKLPFQPQSPHDQELPGGPVPLKVPPDGDAATDAVLGDDQHYGLATDLGAEEMIWRQQLEQEAMQQLPDEAEPPTAEEQRNQLQQLLDWEPPSKKYIYNKETGILHTTEGMEGMGGRVAKEYIEDVATGDFYKINDPGLWRRLGQMFERHQMDGDDNDPEDTSVSARLKASAQEVSNIMSLLGFLVQGLLAGFALLNFFVHYILYNKNYLAEFLAYYAPPAMTFSRIFYTLISLSVIAATTRFCQDQMRGFKPSKLRLRWVDALQVLLYAAAYIVTLMCTPYEDELSYSYKRDRQFYLISFNKDFGDRLKKFHTQNTFRCLFSGLGWILVCYQHSPYVFENTIKCEIKQGMALLNVPRHTMFDNAAAMAAPVPVTVRHGSRQPVSNDPGQGVTSDSATAVASGVAAHATYSIRRVSRSARSTAESLPGPPGT